MPRREGWRLLALGNPANEHLSRYCILMYGWAYNFTLSIKHPSLRINQKNCASASSTALKWSLCRSPCPLAPVPPSPHLQASRLHCGVFHSSGRVGRHKPPRSEASTLARHSATSSVFPHTPRRCLLPRIQFNCPPAKSLTAAIGFARQALTGSDLLLAAHGTQPTSRTELLRARRRSLIETPPAHCRDP